MAASPKQPGSPTSPAAFLSMAEGGPAAYPSAAGPQSATEQVLWQGSPSLKVVIFDGVRTALVSAAVIVATVLAYRPLLEACARFADQPAAFSTQYSPGFRLAAILLAATLVGIRLGRLGWRVLSLRHHVYRVTNQRLTMETGVLSKTVNEIDMRTVEDVGLRQSAVERFFKIGRIEIAGSDLGPMWGQGQAHGSTSGASRLGKARLSIFGIPDPGAVRELIRGAAYQATRGQLFTRST